MKKIKVMNEKAAALVYDQTGAPRIVAKGAGEVARKMIEVAEAEGIPIQKNEVLVEALMQVELTREIPPQLYRAVAEILAFVYRLEKAKSRVSTSSPIHNS
jgi:flagellar biosynthesis protein